MSSSICSLHSHTLSLLLSYSYKDAGETSPSCIVPTVAGVQKVSSSTVGDQLVFGDVALDPKQISARLYPMENGVVRDWETMDQIIAYGFHSLFTNNNYKDDDGQIDESSLHLEYNFADSKIILTEPSLNPLQNRKKVCEYMFENMNFQALNLSNQSLLVLYARGLVSGMVVECGEGITQVVPVYEGIVPHHLIKRHAITGKTITSYLKKLLQLQGFNAKLASDVETLRKIKQTYCYSSCDLNEDRCLARETTVLVENYALPDGTVIKVGQERFEATEAYFDPSLVDVECEGLSDFVFDTIQECDIDCRPKLYEHIVLS